MAVSSSSSWRVELHDIAVATSSTGGISRTNSPASVPLLLADLIPNGTVGPSCLVFRSARQCRKRTSTRRRWTPPPSSSRGSDDSLLEDEPDADSAAEELRALVDAGKYDLRLQIEPPHEVNT